MGKEVYSNADTLFLRQICSLTILATTCLFFGCYRDQHLQSNACYGSPNSFTSRNMELFMNCNFETVIVEE